jgi:hypothetical protein
MLLGGRRINTQKRGVFERQAKLAALTMSESYKRHPIFINKMGLKAPVTIKDLTARIDARRENDKTKKRQRHKKNSTGVGYKKDEAGGVSSEKMEKKIENPIDPKELTEKCDEVLAKIQNKDLNWIRQLVDISSDSFLEAARFHLPTTTAVNIYKCKETTLLKPSEAFLNSLKLNQMGPPLHLRLPQQQMGFEKKKKTVVTKCGLFINPTRRFLISKPDGLVTSLNGVFRGFPDAPPRKYLQELAMLDLFCTGRDKAFYITKKDENTELISYKKDDFDEEFLKQYLDTIEKFYNDHILKYFATSLLRN